MYIKEHIFGMWILNILFCHKYKNKQQPPLPHPQKICLFTVYCQWYVGIDLIICMFSKCYTYFEVTDAKIPKKKKPEAQQPGWMAPDHKKRGSLISYCAQKKKNFLKMKIINYKFFEIVMTGIT